MEINNILQILNFILCCHFGNRVLAPKFFDIYHNRVVIYLSNVCMSEGRQKNFVIVHEFEGYEKKICSHESSKTC